MPLISTAVVYDVVSGFTVSLAFLALSAVFSSIMFGEIEGLEDKTTLGLSLSLISVCICCLTTSFSTSTPAIIAGPNINSVVQFATMGMKIAESVSDPQVLLSTYLFTICMTTLFIAFTSFTIGYFHLYFLLEYIPMPVLNGFLGCIGYKIVVAAIKTAVGKKIYHPEDPAFWYMLIIAMVLGLSLYGMKYTTVPSYIYIAIFFTVPCAFFYAIGLGVSDFNTLQYNGWLFPPATSFQFWETWNLMSANIDFEVFSEQIPRMMICSLILNLDMMMNYLSIKKLLREINPSREYVTSGFQNILVAIFVGLPGYGQIKQTLMNTEISKPPSKVAGIVCGCVAMVLYMVGFPIATIIPRFLLAAMVLFAGLDFVVKNIIKSWWRMSLNEYAIVMTIVIVNATTELIYAIVTGFVLSGLLFVLQYSKNSIISSIYFGSDYSSKIMRSLMDERLLSHLGRQIMIVRLQNYIFFGSSSQVKVRVQKMLMLNDKVQYFILDLSKVTGVDYTGVNVLEDLQLWLKGRPLEIELIFAGVSEKIRTKIIREFHSEVSFYNDIDEALQKCENQCLRNAATVRQLWLRYEPLRIKHQFEVLKAKYDVFEHLFSDMRKARDLWKYIEEKGKITVYDEKNFDSGSVMCLQESVKSGGGSDDDDEESDSDEDTVDSARSGSSIKWKWSGSSFFGQSKRRDGGGSTSLFRSYFSTDGNGDGDVDERDGDGDTARNNQDRPNPNPNALQSSFLRAVGLGSGDRNSASFLGDRDSGGIAFNDVELVIGDAGNEEGNSNEDIYRPRSLSQDYTMDSPNASYFSGLNFKPIEVPEGCIRLHTITREAFLNPDQLTPKQNLDHLYVAEEDSILVKISRDNLELMKREHPEAAFELYNSVIDYIFFTNRKLMNQTEAPNKVKGLRKQMIQRRRSSTIVNNAHSRACTEIDHLFHHIRVAADAPEAAEGCMQDKLLLSEKMMKDAKKIFSHHMGVIIDEDITTPTSMGTSSSEEEDMGGAVKGGGVWEGGYEVMKKTEIKTETGSEVKRETGDSAVGKNEQEQEKLKEKVKYHRRDDTVAWPEGQLDVVIKMIIELGYAAGQRVFGP